MNISELSIRRPVLSTVLTLIILLFGFIGYNYLGVREYPSVDNPIISVSCSYPGANADVIENQITEPLEQNINGIPGIRSLSSVSQQGSSRITVEFELSVDLETAANDVRDKVSRAQRYLPRDCDPPTVSKADADATPILMVALQSDKRSLLELSEIADLTVKEQLQTISDVSSVSIWGEKRYSMRLWLDPIKMSGYGITPLDVKNAVDNENVELPSGSIEGNTTELTIRTLGLMHTAEEFNNLILKEDGNRIVRFSDIGRAELGPADIKSYMKMNGVPMVGVVVIPQPGANHIEIANAVYDRMEKMKKDLPEDVHYNYGFDNTKFIRASIDEVKQTVYEAFVLVIIIIFLFLRDWRVTLVPCIVIPVSLIGAFFVMYLAGFSINVLSMLAVVLAVGLVVDDAIVVVENVDAVKAYDELLKSELNIKNIEFSTLQDASAHGLKIVHELRVNARAAGPRLGKQVQFAIKASKSGDWHVDAASGAPVVSTPSGDLALVEGEYELINRVEEENATVAAASVSAALPTGGFVILDTALDDDLLAEGYARDVIRSVQDARKAADLDIADRIALVLTVPAVNVAKVEQFKDLIARETLATSFEVKEGAELAVEVAKA